MQLITKMLVWYDFAFVILHEFFDFHGSLGPGSAVHGKNGKKKISKQSKLSW